MWCSSEKFLSETNNIMKTKTLLALFAFVLAGGLSAAGLYHAASHSEPVYMASDDPCGQQDPTDPGDGGGNADDMPGKLTA